MTKNEELEYYKKMLGIGDYDPAKVAFIIYLKLLTQQTSFLSDFTIKAHIDTADKDSPQYKRAMEMFDRIPSAIKSVSELRSMLKLILSALCKSRTLKDNHYFCCSNSC